MSCSTNKSRHLTHEYSTPDIVVEEEIETVKFHVVSNILHYLERLKELIREIITRQKELCMKGVYNLKNEWKNEFCDVLRGNAKENCLKERKSVPAFIDEMCTEIVVESLIVNFDPLLVIAIIKNESNFGIIKKSLGEHQVSMNVCEQQIAKNKVSEILESKCKREKAKKMIFTSGRKLCVYILREEERYYTVDTCIAGEAGPLQLITANYYRGRSIPRTNETIEGDTQNERRTFINENMRAAIRIGIEELAIHRDVFPEKERIFWGDWIGCYNTGGTTRRGKWMLYATRVLKNYAQLCYDDETRNYFHKNCEDLKKFRWVWN